MRSLLASLGVTVLVAACNGSQPLPASRGMSTAPDPPVVGAHVLVRYPGAENVASAVTDGHGYYSFSDVRPGPRFGGAVIVFISKAGYFMEFPGAPLSKDTQLDVALHPWVHIALDAATRGRVGDICESPGPCERYAFTPPSAGTLELTAPAFPFDLEVPNPNGRSVGSFYAQPGSSPA